MAVVTAACEWGPRTRAPRAPPARPPPAPPTPATPPPPRREALPGDDKVVYLMRHGETEMNVWLRDFRAANGPAAVVDLRNDPRLYDTRLTARGIAGARARRGAVAALDPRPEVVLVSPLSRALHTAELAFARVPDVPRRVEPLATEKLWHSSDVGSTRAELHAEWGDRYDVSHLDDVWWYTGGTGDPRAIVDEPEADFHPRMERLRRAVAARPERAVAVVCHWGVIHALTGEAFDNCEMRKFRLSDLKARPLPPWEHTSD